MLAQDKIETLRKEKTPFPITKNRWAKLPIADREILCIDVRINPIVAQFNSWYALTIGQRAKIISHLRSLELNCEDYCDKQAAA